MLGLPVNIEMTISVDAGTIVSNIQKLSNNNTTESISSPNWIWHTLRMLLSEFVSTCFLMCVGCMSCIPIAGYDQQPPLNGALGFGFAVMVMVQTFGHISGAHMNPSVTLAAVIWGSTTPLLGAMFAIVQCAGSIVGCYILTLISAVDFAGQKVCVVQPYGLNEGQAFGVEFMLTATLIFLCCGAWDPVNEKRQDSVAIKMALGVAGLSIAGGAFTGASMNPARTLGPAIVTGVWTSHWVYWTAPFAGSGAAVLLYKHCLLKK